MIPKASYWAGWALVAAAGAIVSGCHNDPCSPIGFDEGERFQIDVIGRAQEHPDPFCSMPSLAPGDSFTLTAGAEVLDPPHCSVRGAQAGAPPFSTGILTSCTERSRQLGLMCTGMDAGGCGVSVNMEIPTLISRGASVIERGTLWMMWSMDAACNTGGCFEVYDVRIERL